MIARAFSKMTPAARSLRVGGQQVRNASGLPIPPKIATPKSVGSSGSGSNTDAVVSFYKALPKGNEPEKRASGIKGKYFDGKNASGKPIIGVIAALMIGGYTLEYNGHLSTYTKTNAVQSTTRTRTARYFSEQIDGLADLEISSGKGKKGGGREGWECCQTSHDPARFGMGRLAQRCVWSAAVCRGWRCKRPVHVNENICLLVSLRLPAGLPWAKCIVLSVVVHLMCIST